MTKGKLLLTIFILFSGFQVFSQEKKIDSLYSVYYSKGNEYSLEEKLEAANDIGFLVKDSDPDSAIRFLEEAILFAHQTDQPYHEALFTSRIGGAYYVKGVYDKSLEYFSRALHMWELIGSNKGVIKGLNNVALIYNMVGEKQKALSNHYESAQMCIQHNDSIMLGLNYLNMTIIYTDIDEYDSARHYVERSNLIFSDLDMFDFVMKTEILLGHLELKMDEYDQATRRFTKVLDNENFKNDWERAYALLGKANAEQKKGNYFESIKLAHEGLEKSIKINALWDINYASEILSDAYSSIGDFKNAYYYTKLFKKYNDSIYNKENKTRIDYLLLKQKEVEYLLLEEKNSAQEEEIEKKNTQLFMMILTVVVVLIIVVLLFRFIIVKTRLNDQMRQKNAEIAAKNVELTNLNKTKDTLFRIIGHDLRNPVSHIASFTDLILTNYENLSEEDIKEFVKISKDSAQSAIDLLTNLLDWARTQTGSNDTHIESVSILNVVNDSFKGLANSFKKKNIDLDIQMDKDLTANLDQNMMVVILRNLLSNAIKFTPNNGLIKVKAKRDEDNLIIDVVDKGIGMSEDKVNSLFNLEKTSSTPGTNNEKGIGVGLLLCKDLVEKQGGNIFVYSTLGKGTKFRIVLH